MSKHDFTSLYEAYPTIIADMPDDIFTSHEFIQRLTQKEQRFYIEALYAYRDDEPFRKVHGILAQRLRDCSDLVIYIDEEKNSRDLFGQSNTASRWRRINLSGQ